MGASNGSLGSQLPAIDDGLMTAGSMLAICQCAWPEDLPREVTLSNKAFPPTNLVSYKFPPCTLFSSRKIWWLGGLDTSYMGYLP